MYSTVRARATTSDPAQRVPTPDQNDVHYASVRINRSKTEEVPLYATVQKPQTFTLDDDVAYESVQFLRGSAATRWAFLRITTNHAASNHSTAAARHLMCSG